MAPAHKVIGWLVKASGSSGTAVTWELDERAYQRPVLIREFGRLLYSTRSTVESWEIGPVCTAKMCTQSSWESSC
jgi:hypothetical protein